MKSSSTASPDKTYPGIPGSQGEEQKRRPGDYTVQLPDAAKGTKFRVEHPRPGMFLSLFNDVLAEDIAISYNVTFTSISFGVLLSGGQRARMSKVPPPCDWIRLFGPCSGEGRLQGDVQYRKVGVILQGELLEKLIKGSEQFGMSIVKSLEKGPDDLLLDRQPSSLETSSLALQILNCPMTGPYRDLYLEGKALEMIALFLHRMADTKPRSTISLSRSDVERIHAARDILLTNLAEPPSLNQLARQAGINEFKLKKGFREVFDCTVYEALRIERLNTANTLLRDSDTTVGDVADEVGYSNLGYFIALFRKHFGVTPGSLLRRARHDKALRL